MPKLTSDQIFALADNLPVVSAAAIQLASKIDDPNTSRDQVVELVSADETLFAQCFKQANSAAIASTREFNTIKEIVDILGLSHIRKVALFVAAKSVINDSSVWFESVFTAMGAQYLARRAGMDFIESDKVYMAGLFLNYGSFLLKTSYPTLYHKYYSLGDFVHRMKQEREEFDTTYPEISALVLDKYGIPPYVTAIINSQQNVYREGYSKENTYIELARVLCSLQKRNADTDTIRDRLDLDEIKGLVEGSGLNLFEIDDKTLERLKNSSDEFSSF